MPERHSIGSSGSSSSNSSNRSSSSSSASSYRLSRRNDNDGPSSPEDQMLGWIAVGVIVIILVILFVGDALSKANQQRQDANATTTTNAITLHDIAQMHAALDPRIPIWRQVTDMEAHHLSASDAGFGPNDNTKEVVYGYCKAKEFYVYILESSRPGGFVADTEGYVYIPDSYSAKDCHPPDWMVVEEDNVNSEWSFVTLNTYFATSAAQRTLTTATSTPITTTPTDTF